jgi:SAM-dependent methyltransferase
MKIARLSQALFARLFFWGSRRCNLCNHRVGRFLPYRDGWKSSSALMRSLNVIGSDLKNFECPWCGAHDRERHMLMYMRAAGIIDAMPAMTILHFAPERRLSKLLEATNPVRYIKCDLYPEDSSTIRVDMLNIHFPDESFDLVIANHVLEHVSDDSLALSELRRILKPGGLAILQTPYSPKLHNTWSDDGIDDNQGRLQAYGQEDHVRLFGRDIFNRIVAAGFVSKVGWHEDMFPETDSNPYGVNVNEPFFLFEREESNL